MFDSQCDLAALVYEPGQDPDEILREFAAELNAAGIARSGWFRLGHHCMDVPKVSAMLVHSGEELQLFQNLGACATGCRLDVGQLLDAGSQVARALEDGADIAIINRFGRQEREGKGLSYLIERALSADIPVVIAVPVHRFADWIRFAGGMSVKLRCDRDALDAWWNSRFGTSWGFGHTTSPQRLRSLQIGRRGRLQSVSCLCPHSLQTNLTRVEPFSAESRFGAPHLPHIASIRVLPCFTTRVSLFHGFADQALGLFPHRLLRHLSAPAAIISDAGL